MSLCFLIKLEFFHQAVFMGLNINLLHVWLTHLLYLNSKLDLGGIDIVLLSRLPRVVLCVAFSILLTLPPRMGCIEAMSLAFAIRKRLVHTLRFDPKLHYIFRCNLVQIMFLALRLGPILI